MGDWRRHAIYFAPREGSALAEFGADWLGWEAATGADREGRELPGLPRPRRDLVAVPRRYGFHATLKAPFRLAAGRDAAALDAATAALAAGFSGFAIGLRLAVLGRFLALVPATPSPQLAELEAACVVRLDVFRAPPDPQELARRRAAGLDATEEANLQHWGYPYVLARFRFHLTLTGPLDRTEIAPTEAALAAALDRILAIPVPVAEIGHFGEGADGRFRLVRRHPLAG